jgi:hypothetical protein
MPAASSAATKEPTAAELETQLEEHIAEFVDDPLGFVLWAYPWGEGDLAGETGPDEWQSDLLREIGEKCLTCEGALRIAVAAGHGVGKSTLIAWIMQWLMSTRPDFNGVCTANTAAQLKTKTWRELSIWHKRLINAHWFEWTATKFCHVAAPDTWAINAIPWSIHKPEAFAGLHAEHVAIFMDEASAIPDIIHETAEGAMTTPGAMWFQFGNPTRNTGRFREAFGRFKHRFLLRQVDSRTAKKADRTQIKQWQDDYGEDSDFFRIRVRGVFPRAGSTQFISSDDVELAMKRDDCFLKTPRIMGIDVARFGDDQSVILVRDGDLVSRDLIKTYRGIDLVQLAGHAAEMINNHKPQAVVVDGTGVGGGVVDILRSRGFQIIEFNGGNEPADKAMYFNKRAEAWGKMRDWLRNGRAVLPPDLIDLRDDLIGIEYGFANDGQIQLERKQDLKKRGLSSPDLGDALAMTFGVTVADKAVASQTFSGGLPKTVARGDRDKFAGMYRRR